MTTESPLTTLKYIIKRINRDEKPNDPITNNNNNNKQNKINPFTITTLKHIINSINPNEKQTAQLTTTITIKLKQTTQLEK